MLVAFCWRGEHRRALAQRTAQSATQKLKDGRQFVGQDEKEAAKMLVLTARRSKSIMLRPPLHFLRTNCPTSIGFLSWDAEMLGCSLSYYQQLVVTAMFGATMPLWVLPVCGIPYYPCDGSSQYILLGGTTKQLW